MRSCIVASIFAMPAASLWTEQNFNTRSGAPFTIEKTPCLPGWPWTVSIHLFSELNGISKSLLFVGLSLLFFTCSAPPCTSVHALRIAISVGEPVHLCWPSSILISAPLFRIPVSATRATFSFISFGKEPVALSRRTRVRPSAAMPPGPARAGTARSWTSISPLVSVPVLSEQNTETHPRVSTASIFLTSTFLLAIWSEAIMREMVTVGSKPSGTCAKSAAALFCKMSAGERLTGDMRLAMRLSSPTTMATTAMMCTKCSIWISRVDFTLEDLIP
mmetsp:Transcript_62121/g.133571  ORF Transcript_62121/g.133571 Transcript_62121/m.133571 type:complete len:275 (-) Transcript_62121:1158-1982(-)